MKALKTFLLIFVVLGLIFSISYFAIVNIGTIIGKPDHALTGQLSNARLLPEDSPNNSFGIGSYRSFDASVPLYSTQYINNNTFDGYLELINSYNISNQYLLIALLNYRIVPFTYNDTMDSAHLIDAQPDTAYIYPFNISGIPPGFNDVLFLSIQNPYNYYINMTFRDPRTNNSSIFKVWNEFPSICSKRFNIINGTADKPMIEHNMVNINNSSINLYGLSITKEPLSNRSLMYENVSENDTKQYYINVANSENANISFAIIQMLDYEQIPISNNSSDLVFYGYLEKGKASSIPASISVPQSKGIHELIVLMVTEPYKNIETIPGELNPDVVCAIEARSVGINVV